MTKSLKYILGIIIALLLIYFSVDIQNLQEYQANNSEVEFDAVDFATRIWNEKLPLAFTKAPEVNIFLNKLNDNPEQAFADYGKKLGIAKTHYFMLQGTGTVQTVEDECFYVDLKNGNTIQIATAFIFGNAVRDGSGQVKINDFINMTDFNNVSIELNKLVRSKVVSRLQKSVKAGNQIEFAGVAELRINEEIPQQIKIIPVKANLSNGTN